MRKNETDLFEEIELFEEGKNAVREAVKLYEQANGKLEEGDMFIALFHNCFATITVEEEGLIVSFHEGEPVEPVKVDLSLSIYEEDEQDVPDENVCFVTKGKDSMCFTNYTTDCGHLYPYTSFSEGWKFCPNCGRRIVIKE